MNKIGYFPGIDPHNNCVQLLCRHAETRPDRPALIWSHVQDVRALAESGAHPLAMQVTSYGELFDCASRLAASFEKLTIGKGDAVILYLPMSPQLYAALIALQMRGATAVFLDSWAEPRQLNHVAALTAPKAMMAAMPSFALCADQPHIAGIPHRITPHAAAAEGFLSLELLMAAEDRTNGICAVEGDDTALITFTTGSSGTPKGANRTHRFLAAQHYALSRSLPYLDSDCDLSLFPIMAINNMASGIPTVIPALEAVSAQLSIGQILLAQMSSGHASCATFNPALLMAVVKAWQEGRAPRPCLRRILVGGAAVSRDLLSVAQAIMPDTEIVVAYGSTEVEPIAHIHADEILMQSSGSHQDPERVDDGVLVGKFVEGLQYKFLKIDKNPITIKSSAEWRKWEVAPLNPGEIVVSGEHVCQSYFKDDEAFERAKIRDEEGRIWHRTGDVGRLDAAGNIWLVGRVHNTIERQGQFLFPVGAEMVLRRMPFVGDAAYLGLPDSIMGEKACVVITLRRPETAGDAAALNGCKTEIERLMAKNGFPVDDIIVLNSIPLDPRHRSKVEYAVLRDELMRNPDVLSLSGSLNIITT
jgi:acyl-CoA synthetase (AMP-forming)/AMP-acid ligase II